MENNKKKYPKSIDFVTWLVLFLFLNFIHTKINFFVIYTWIIGCAVSMTIFRFVVNAKNKPNYTVTWFHLCMASHPLFQEWDWVVCWAIPFSYDYLFAQQYECNDCVYIEQTSANILLQWLFIFLIFVQCHCGHFVFTEYVAAQVQTKVNTKISSHIYTIPICKFWHILSKLDTKWFFFLLFFSFCPFSIYSAVIVICNEFANHLFILCVGFFILLQAYVSHTYIFREVKREIQ